MPVSVKSTTLECCVYSKSSEREDQSERFASAQAKIAAEVKQFEMIQKDISHENSLPMTRK